MGRRSNLPPVAFDLDEFARTLGTGGQIWARPCNFDHPSVPVVTHAILTVREGVTLAVTAVTYSGKLAGSLAPGVLDLSAGKPVADVGKLLARLAKDGYRVIYEAPEPPAEPEPGPAAEAPKKRRGGRPKKAVTE